MIIFQTAPFWTTILSMLFNREKVFCYEYVAMFLCFCGVVCMSQPSGKEKNDTLLSGIAVGVLMAIVYSSVNVMNRMLKGVHFAVIGIYHAMFGTAIAVVFLVS